MYIKKTIRKLISLQPEYHVNRQVKPGSAKAQEMTVGSGLTALELYEKQCPNGLLSKTFLDYLVSKGAWTSKRCLLKWKILAMKSSHRLLFRLQLLTPRIKGNEYVSLLKTLSTIEVRSEKMKSKSISGTSGTLAQEMKSGYIMKRAIKENVIFPSKNIQNVGIKTGIQLQPVFAEWMMGYPEGWTDLNYRLKNIEIKD